MTLTHATIAAIVPTTLERSTNDGTNTTAQPPIAIMILYEQSEATETLFPPAPPPSKDRSPEIVALLPLLFTPVVSISLGRTSNATEGKQQLLAGSNVTINFAVDSNGAYEEAVRITAIDSIPNLLSCVWWDYELVNPTAGAAEASAGGWSGEGCYLVQAATDAANATQVTCSCNHLTHFAVLFSNVDRTAAHTTGLLVVSYVGVVLGTLGTMAAFWAFAVHRDLVHLPEQIVLNLLVAVGASTLMFIGATEKRANQSETSCKAVSGILHYFLLSCWSWQLCEGQHLYLTFVEVLGGGHPQKKLKWYMLVGWGLPLLFVVPSMIVFSDDYVFTTASGNELCWIDPSSNAVYLYSAPAMVGLVLNTIVCTYVIRAVGTSIESTRKRRTQAIAILAFGTTLGLVYVFGALLMIRPNFGTEIAFAF